MNSKKEKKVSFRDMESVCSFHLGKECLHAHTWTKKCKHECCPAVGREGRKEQWPVKCHICNFM